MEIDAHGAPILSEESGSPGVPERPNRHRGSRGIIIRGAGFLDLWPSVAALLLIASLLVAGSTGAFHKTIS